MRRVAISGKPETVLRIVEGAPVLRIVEGAPVLRGVLFWEDSTMTPTWEHENDAVKGGVRFLFAP